jgi:hypothetical protein
MYHQKSSSTELWNLLLLLDRFLAMGLTSFLWIFFFYRSQIMLEIKKIDTQKEKESGEIAIQTV